MLVIKLLRLKSLKRAMFACLELQQLKSIIYQYSDINLRAALSEGGGRMWPPGRQLPMYGLMSIGFGRFIHKIK